MNDLIEFKGVILAWVLSIILFLFVVGIVIFGGIRDGMLKVNTNLNVKEKMEYVDRIYA